MSGGGDDNDLYSLSLELGDGSTLSTAELRGKVVYAINVASN